MKAALYMHSGSRTWTILVGFAMDAMGILPYHVTMVGILGAIVVVIGILLVVAKPSELLDLRSN